MKMPLVGGCLSLVLVAASLPTAASAQIQNVVATVTIKRPQEAGSSAAGNFGSNASGVVVWLTPADGTKVNAVAKSAKHPEMAQHNRAFEPNLLVVPVGSTVDFPNKDPFFHNVFSLFDGKRFDLGLYEAGGSSSVRFDRVGVSLLFCNIHPEMNAVVIALDTPYYGVSDRAGSVELHGVPDGDYQVHVWYERSSLESLHNITRVAMVSSSSRNLGVISLTANPVLSLTHKNKYGQEYPSNSGTSYKQP
jgi:plastocyanin